MLQDELIHMVFTLWSLAVEVIDVVFHHMGLTPGFLDEHIRESAGLKAVRSVLGQVNPGIIEILHGMISWVIQTLHIGNSIHVLEVLCGGHVVKDQPIDVVPA